MCSCLVSLCDTNCSSILEFSPPGLLTERDRGKEDGKQHIKRVVVIVQHYIYKDGIRNKILFMVSLLTNILMRLPICNSSPRYERVYQPLCKVAETPFHIQGDELM